MLVPSRGGHIETGTGATPVPQPSHLSLRDHDAGPGLQLPLLSPCQKSIFCEDSGGLAACSQSTPQQPHLSGLTLRLQALSLCALTCVSTAQICLLYHGIGGKRSWRMTASMPRRARFTALTVADFAVCRDAKLASCMLLKVIKATAVFAKICKTSC